MEVFTQNKVLIRIVIFLVLLNIVSIGAYLWRDNSHKDIPPVRSEEKDRKENKRDVSEILERELKLNDRQTEQMRKIRADFFEKEKILSETIRNQRDSMNAAMFNKSTDVEFVKSIAKRIAETEYNMEILRFEQSQAFKSICTPEQLEKFEKLVKEIRDYFKPQGPPK